MKVPRAEQTDAQRFFVDVRATGFDGAHSHDLAASIPSLNVSQRAKDTVSKGQQVYTRSERRNGRPGARFWLDGFQPSDAVPVRPNNGSEGEQAVREGSGSSRSAPSAAPLSTEPTCPRCEGDGKLWSGVECPSCLGDGTISPRRVNSLPRAA